MKSNYKNILVGIDGSEESEKAFLKAKEIAKNNEAELVIAWINTELERRIPGEELSDREELIYSRYVSVKEAEAKNDGVKKVIPVVMTGEPKKYLSKVIPQKFNSDLIILGATSTNIVRNILIGSTAKYVVKNSKCSVLIVK
ncbi:universal stress protein [Vagococcus fluvialis]|uniref:universal stress protein n=1 Tax=Vagococcus fluvialis TaxID=2738 RepID=UPI001A8F9F77|nr:universal stress protein [Vagococcus fluvialis]MBO0479677.1 universal stress protein [Vagococcus fluvialis]MBO0483698.1 universal stress protein [Vagococcus fluvialis]UDM71367.1 universal stress protein [Vagococcus fluvialis]UDM74609.1 universal stress protein [Vagococcus fluvialis]UDM76230.1 universal stress protein [Vagococcus fluvialis]